MAWRPLGVVAAALLCAVIVAAATGGPPVDGTVAIVAVAALVAAAVLALDDPAYELTSSVPVGLGRRVAHRVALVAPATFVTALLLGGLARALGLLDDPSSVLAPGAALGAFALAVHLTVVGRWPANAATLASAAPGGWVVLGLTAGGPGWLAAATHAWRDRPGVVALAAPMLAIAGSRLRRL